MDDRERVVVRWTLAHDDRARKRHDELAHLPIRAFKRRLLDHVPGVVFRARGHCRKRQVGIRIDRRRSLAAITASATRLCPVGEAPCKRADRLANSILRRVDLRDPQSTRLNSSYSCAPRMPAYA